MHIAFEAPRAIDWTPHYSAGLLFAVGIIGLFALATLVAAIRQRR